MPTVADVVTFLEQFAPLDLAEEWDNVGLLIGNRRESVARVMTCLTLTPTSVAEAVNHAADLIVTHHPLPFRPFNRITSDSLSGQLLLDLISAKIAVYSPHTAFDSAAGGINEQLAEGLGLQQIEPLIPNTDPVAMGGSRLGAGRLGMLRPSLQLTELATRVKTFLSIGCVRLVGDDTLKVERVAVACGSGGSLLAPARQANCDCLVTGETNFHSCLEAQATGILLLLTGHYASERFALETLAAHVNQHLDVEAWASREETDPLREL